MRARLREGNFRVSGIRFGNNGDNFIIASYSFRERSAVGVCSIVVLVKYGTLENVNNPVCGALLFVRGVRVGRGVLVGRLVKIKRWVAVLVGAGVAVLVGIFVGVLLIIGVWDDCGVTVGTLGTHRASPA